MKIRRLFYTLFLLLPLAGCAPVNRTVFRVAKVAQGTKEAARVKLILRDVAGKTGLAAEDFSQTDVPGLFALYGEPGTAKSRTSLDGQFIDGEMAVDVSAGLGHPAPAKYVQVRDLTGVELRKAFGKRVSEDIVTQMIW